VESSGKRFSNRIRKWLKARNLHHIYIAFSFYTAPLYETQHNTVEEIMSRNSFTLPNLMPTSSHYFLLFYFLVSISHTGSDLLPSLTIHACISHESFSHLFSS